MSAAMERSALWTIPTELWPQSSPPACARGNRSNPGTTSSLTISVSLYFKRALRLQETRRATEDARVAQMVASLDAMLPAGDHKSKLIPFVIARPVVAVANSMRIIERGMAPIQPANSPNLVAVTSRPRAIGAVTIWSRDHVVCCRAQYPHGTQYGHRAMQRTEVIWTTVVLGLCVLLGIAAAGAV